MKAGPLFRRNHGSPCLRLCGTPSSGTSFPKEPSLSLPKTLGLKVSSAKGIPVLFEENRLSALLKRENFGLIGIRVGDGGTGCGLQDPQELLMFHPVSGNLSQHVTDIAVYYYGCM
jgi:hypothetical protein